MSQVSQLSSCNSYQVMVKTIWTMAARVAIFCSTLAAAIVIVTSHATSTIDKVIVEANYYDWPPLRYFMVINFITCFYTLFPICLWSGSLLWRLVAALDLIISTLMATACASCAVIVYVIKNGIPQVGCPTYHHLVPDFTSHVIGALSVSCLAILLQFGLCIYTYGSVMNPLLLP